MPSSCRRSCCASCRTGGSRRSAARASSRPTCASSPPPAASAWTRAHTCRRRCSGRLGAAADNAPAAARPPRGRRPAGRLLPRATGRRRAFEPEAFHALMLHTWPLNVRELSKVVTEAEALSRTVIAIGLEHLPDAITATLQIDRRGRRRGHRRRFQPPPRDHTRADPGHDAPRRRPRAGAARPVARGADLAAGRSSTGSVAQVARRLNRQYAVVWRSIQRYGIDAEPRYSRTRNGRTSKRPPRRPPNPSRSARIVLRQGNARPLWFGHPWVYANAVSRVEGEPAARRRRVAGRPRRPLHRPRLLQPAVADPPAPVHARRRAVDAAFFRSRVARARAPRRASGYRRRTPTSTA